MKKGRGHSGDLGQASGEYIVVVLLIGSLSGALTLGTDIGDRILAGIQASVCKLVVAAGGTDCGNLPEDLTPKELRPCMVHEEMDQQVTQTHVVLYSREQRDRTIEQRYSDGSIRVTTGGDSRNGVGLEAGYGLKVMGKGAEISGGGAYRWMAEDRTTYTFDDERQRDEFYRRVGDESRAYVDANGFLAALDEDAYQRIPFDIADDMGVEYTTFYGEGNDGYLRAGGAFGPLSGEGRARGLDVEGVETNSDGTTVEYYRSRDRYDARGALGIKTPEWAVRGEAQVGGRGEGYDGSTIAVHSDADGNPTKAVITTEDSWDAGGDGAVGLQWKAGKGKGGPKWTPWSPRGGDTTLTRVEIPLEGDQKAHSVVERMLHPPAPDGGTDEGGQRFEREMRDLIDDYTAVVADSGTISVREYDRTKTVTEGFNFSGSYFVKILGFEDESELVTLDLEDAYYLDPRTGERTPWTACTEGSG